MKIKVKFHDKTDKDIIKKALDCIEFEPIKEGDFWIVVDVPTKFFESFPHLKPGDEA